MRWFVASARKDLRRFSADPAAVLLWLGVPVVLGGLMHVAMGGSGGPQPVAHLLVADEDDSWLTDLLANAPAGAGGVLRVEEVERAEGERALAEGEASALLVLPEGFTDALLLGTPATLELVTNPAQRILPGILEEGLELVVEAAFYVQALFGEPIRDIAAAAEGDAFHPEAETARIAVEFRRRFESLGDGLFPPAIALESVLAGEPDGEARPDVTFSALYFPGLICMGLLFTCLGLSLDLWQEREMGTLRRALATPRGAPAFLAGKLAAGAAVLAVICVVGVALGVQAYGYPWSAYPVAVLWSVFTGAAFLAVFLALQGLSSSQRGGNVLATLILFPLIMLGGSFFPFEAMPGWMADVGRLTPNGLAVEELKQVLFRGEPTGRRSLALLVLGACGVLGFGVLVLGAGRRAGGGA